MPKDLISISLRLEPGLLEKIDGFCAENGEGRSSFIRRACMEVIEGRLQAPASPSSTQNGPCVDQEARAALEALLARVERLEAGKPSSGFADRFA